MLGEASIASQACGRPAVSSPPASPNAGRFCGVVTRRDPRPPEGGQFPPSLEVEAEHRQTPGLPSGCFSGSQGSCGGSAEGAETYSAELFRAGRLKTKLPVHV